MGSRGHDIRIGNRARVYPCGNQSRNMRHVHKEYGTDLIGYFSKLFKIDHSRISGCTGNNHFRLMLLCQGANLVIIKIALFRNTIRHDVVKKTGKVYRGPVCQVSARIQTHSENRVSRLANRHGHRHIGLCTGVGLYIGIFRAEKLLHSFNGNVFHLVHFLTTAVITLSGIAFRVFIG